MNRFIAIISLFLMLSAPIFASADDEEKADDSFFAVATLSTGDKDVYLGDSVIVTITLYATQSFSQITPKSNEAPRMKNCAVRFYARSRYINQGVSAYKGKRYYAMVMEQFAVTPSELGTFTFPKMQYTAELAIQERSRSYDPFEDFFGFGSTRIKKIKKEGQSEPLKFKVVKRPPKTIRELQQSGATVM